MANSFGLSFDPSAAVSQGPQGGAGPRPSGSPIQQAIQYLSLRMPRVTGAQAPVDPRLLAGSPQALRQGPSPRANAVVESVLRSILGPEHAMTSPQIPPDVSGPITGAPSGLPSGGGGFGGGFPGAPQPMPQPPTAPPTPSFTFPTHEQSPPSGGPELVPSRPPEQPGRPAGGPPELVPPIGGGGGGGPEQTRSPRPDLIAEAVRRVGATSDWNSYKPLSASDPFVQMFSDAFGAGSDWNALRPR